MIKVYKQALFLLCKLILRRFYSYLQFTIILKEADYWYKRYAYGLVNFSESICTSLKSTTSVPLASGFSFNCSIMFCLTTSSNSIVDRPQDRKVKTRNKYNSFLMPTIYNNFKRRRLPLI